LTTTIDISDPIPEYTIIFEENWSWETFINSEYNTMGLRLIYDVIKPPTEYGSSYILSDYNDGFVDKNSPIIPNSNYYWYLD